jgi:hypothetical protein
MASLSDKAQEAKWKAEDDLRTLRTADEISNDPSRLKAAKKMAGEQIKALSKVSGTLLTGKKGDTLIS